MNRFDEIYDIRRAYVSEIDEIMSFINAEWKPGHILGTNRSFFEYEHVINGEVNFIIAKNRQKHNISGILGYIPASIDKKHLDIWTVVWKVRSDSIPFLGMEMNKRIPSITGSRAVIGLGENPNTTIRLYKTFLRNTIRCGKMLHYVLLADLKEYSIAKIVDYKISFVSSKKETFVYKIENVKDLCNYIDFEKNKDCYPYKDIWYLEHRYFNHPIYKYQVYGLIYGEKKAVIITRLQACGSKNVLRIVDYIGVQECFSGLNKFFVDYMTINNCEYTDFYILGFDTKYIEAAGFVLVSEPNIIPNYFYPFVRENIDIWVSSTVDNCLFCKADSDQDRPS